MISRLTFTTILFSFLAVFSSVTAQRSFHRTIDSLSISNETYISGNPSGGYVAVGINTSPPPEMYDGLVIFSYDACDELKWCRTVHNESSRLFCNNIFVTSKDEIVVTGKAEGPGTISDIFLLKLDARGNTIFFQRYITSQYSFIFSVGELKGGGYFISGGTVKMPWVNKDFVLKTDENGVVEWAYEYFLLGQWAWGHSIGTSDGSILVNNGRQMYKLDPAGTIQWSKNYADIVQFRESEPVEVEDGYVYMQHSGVSLVDTASHLFKVDLTGNLVWNGDVFPGVGAGSGGVVRLNNGHFVTISDLYIDTIGGFRNFVLLTELNAEGRFLAQSLKMSPEDVNYRVYDVANAGGNSVVICGIEENLVNFDSRLFISKTVSTIHQDECTIALRPVYKDKIPLTITDTTVQPVPLGVASNTITEISRMIHPREVISCSNEVPLNLDLGSDINQCKGFSVKLDGGNDFPQFLWSTGETTSSIVVKEAGVYSVIATNGCDTLHDTIAVDFYPELIIDYKIHPLKTNTSEKVRFESFTKGNPAVIWEFQTGYRNELQFEHGFSEPGRYRVVYSAIDQYGCSANDTAYIDVEGYCSLFIPKSFTPDGDGRNDVFEPKGTGIQHYLLEVFTRWGDLVYSAGNGSWDGTLAGKPMPVDAYVYEISISNVCGEKQTKRDIVTLVR